MNTMDYKPKINDKPLELYYGLEVCFRSGRVSHRDALMLCELEESMLSIKAYSPSSQKLITSNRYTIRLYRNSR